MPICKHCSHQSTLPAAADARCPVCGFAYEFDADDWDFDAEVSASEPGARTEPLEKLRSSDHRESDVPAETTGGGTDPEVEFEADPTLAFGGRAFPEDGDELEDDYFALEDGTDEPSELDATQAYLDASGLSGDSERLDDTKRLDLPSDLNEKRGKQGDSSREDVTLPRGLSGSDSAGGSSASSNDGTRKDVSGDLLDSGTVDIRGGSSRGRSSYGVPTPESRDLEGWDTGATTPRGALGDNHASQSLRASDSWQLRHENVRLREQNIAYTSPLEKAEYEASGQSFAGGMGEVFRMRQKSMDRYVALKRPKKGKKSSEKERDGLVSEGVITGQLEHPNIVPVHDIGFDGDGTPFYTMKWVEGEEWEDALRRKALTESENIEILIKVSQAIAYAHSRNIIHRDLKPGNIWLGKFGEVLVMDWGLAARLDSNEGIVPSGTPIYMPPETALAYLEHSKGSIYGTDASASVQRLIPPGTYGDIYLLGALLFKLVTGKAPHKGKNTFDCLKNAARNRIRSTSKRSELLSIAYQAMATNPSERQRDVSEFIDQLKSYQSHAQSVTITQRATTELEIAKEAVANGTAPAKVVYANLARALHGFENALELWPGNSRASRRLQETKQLYATSAFENGDYDLATSMLDAENVESAPLLQQVQARQSQRSRRLRLFRTLQYAVAGSLAASLLFIGISIVAGMDAFNQRMAKTALERERLALNNEIIQLDQQKVILLSEQQLNKITNKNLKERKIEFQAANATLLGNNEHLKKISEEAKKASEEAKKESEEAKKESKQAEQAAKLANYEATLGEIRSALAEHGEFAAREIFDAAVADDALDSKFLESAEWSALDRLTDWRQEATPLVENTEHSLVARSANGQQVAIASRVPGRGTHIRVFNRESQQQPQFEFLIEEPVERLALGEQALATLHSGRLKIYGLASGKALNISAPRETAISAMSFHPTENHLFTGDERSGLSMWRIDTATGEVTHQPLGDDLHAEAIVAVGFSPDGKLRFSADKGGHFRVWASGRDAPWNYSHAVVSQGGGIRLTTALITNRDEGGRLFYGSRNGDVYVVSGGWVQNVSSAAAEMVGSLNADLPSVDPDSQQYVSTRRTSSDFARVPQWESNRPDKIATFLEGRSVESLSLDKPDDVHLVLVASGGNRIMVHPLDGAEIPNLKYWRTYHASPVISCVLWGDSGYSTDETGRALKWKWNTDSKQLTFKPFQENLMAAVTDVYLDVDANTLAVGDAAGFVRRYDNLQDPRTQQLLVSGHSTHRAFQAWDLPAMPNRRLTIAADQRACLWDTAEGTLVTSYDLGVRGDVTVVSPNGRYLVTASTQGRGQISVGNRSEQSAGATIMDLESGDQRSLWPAGPRVTAICWLPSDDADEVLLAVGLRDGQVYVWSSKDGRKNLVAASARVHQLPVTALAYDASSNSIFSGDYEGLLARWSWLDSTSPPQRIVLDRLPVLRLECCNGRMLAIQQQGEQVSLSLHDAHSLDSLSLKHQARKLKDATLSRSGEYIVALDHDGSLVSCAPLTGQWKERLIQDQPLTTMQPRVTSVRALDGNQLLCYGAGLAFRIDGWDKTPHLSHATLSRPTIGLIQAANSSNLVSLATDGRITRFATGPKARFESERLFVDTDSKGHYCNSPSYDHSYAASQNGNTLIVHQWERNQSANPTQIGTVENARCEAIAASQDHVALVARQGPNRRLLLMDRSNGRTEVVFDNLPARADGVTMDSRSNRIAVALHDGRVWAAERDATNRWTALPVESEEVSSVAFTPDGERLLIGRRTGQIEFWELKVSNSHFVPKSKLLLTGHSDPVQVLRYLVSGKRKWLVSGDSTGEVVLHQL